MPMPPPPHPPPVIAMAEHQATPSAQADVRNALREAYWNLRSVQGTITKTLDLVLLAMNRLEGQANR